MRGVADFHKKNKKKKKTKQTPTKKKKKKTNQQKNQERKGRGVRHRRKATDLQKRGRKNQASDHKRGSSQHGNPARPPEEKRVEA